MKILRGLGPTLWAAILIAGFQAGVAPLQAKNSYISGSNVAGRKGLLFADTAEVPDEGAYSFSSHLLIGLDDNFDLIQIPLGFNYGIMKDFEFSGNIEYISLNLDGRGAKDRSGIGDLTVGGKYRIPKMRSSHPDFAFGVDISHGPFSNDLGNDSGTDIHLKGMLTKILPNGLLVNGEVGILRAGDRGGGTDTVLQLDGGVGFPFKPNLTGIAELGINQLGDDQGIVAFGLRGGKNPRFKALLGLGLDNGPDITLGGGLTWRFPK